MQLNKLKENFSRDGYVYLNPGELINDELLQIIQQEAKKILPNYSDSFNYCAFYASCKRS